MKREIAAFLISVLCHVLCSNEVYAQFNMLFTSDNDLPNSLVNDIEEDSRGMMWIATEDGLCQYNGSRFKNYSNIPQDKNSLSSNFIRCICTDLRGNVVVAGICGLQIYHHCNDDFSEVVKTEDIGLPTSNVNDVCLLKNGDFLAIGVNCFTLHIDDKGVATVKRNVLSNIRKNGYNVVEAPDGSLWGNYGADGIWHADKHGKMRCVKTATGTNCNFSVICMGRDGRLYAGHVEGGLYVYNPTTRCFDFIAGTEGIIKIRDMKNMPDGNTLCIATDGMGVRFYDLKRHHITQSNTLSDPFIDISTQKAHALFVSKSGDVWMALYQKGIFLATRHVSSFGYIGRRSQQHNIIGNRCVTSLVERRDGTIWVSTDNGGIYGFTKDIQYIRSFAPNDNGGVPMTAMALFEDSRQRLWFGSYNHGGGMMNTENGACHYVPMRGVMGTLFSVYGYAEDKCGQVWAASLGNGIVRYDEQSRQFVGYTCDENTRWSTSIYYDKNTDIIYCGTYDGIRWFSPTDKSRKVHTIGEKAVVYSITRISDNEMAFGTTNGLIIYNTRTSKVRTITTSDGLPSSNIFAVRPGLEGHLWMSSSSGIIRYDMKRNTMEAYTVRDGLQGNEFYKNSSMVSRDGRLWFGGVNGISFFKPGAINSRQNMHCTSRVVSLRAGERYFYADDTGGYTVPSGIETFNIELATLPIYMTKRVTYYYRLDNGEWQMVPTPQNNVLFDKIGYGSHTLYTKAVIDNEESEVTETEVYVRYPWYLRWWMVIVWIIVFTSLIFFTFNSIRRRHELHRELREHHRNEELKEAKLQFFMNIVHDLRTPLTLIATPLQKLKTMNSDAPQRRLYTIMERNTERLLRLTDEIMDLRKIDSGKMELHFHYSLVSRHMLDIANSMSDIIETRRQTLIVEDHTDGNLHAWIDASNFEKIVVNLLANAIKYTPDGGTIKMEWGSADDNLQLVISDNGIGISDDDKEHIFDRFYQVRVNDKHIKGTGIGLNLVKALVELHHGSITVSDNPEGQGTVFVVELPMTHKECDATVATDNAPAEHTAATDRAEDIFNDALAAATDIMPDAAEHTSAETHAEGGLYDAGKGMARKTVLIVDDDNDIRNFLYEELSGAFNVVTCDNGRTAYDMLIKGIEGTSPYDKQKGHVDIIVSDVMMPDIDGLELTRMIRQNIRLNHLPVILLTARASDQERIEGLQASADAYVTKPFNLDLLQTLISNLLVRQDELRNTFKGNSLPVEQIELPELQSADDRLMERLVRVINDNLDNPDLTSDILAREVGLSRGHLYRKLKELTNQSATNYIRNIRLTKAAEMLRQHKISVAEVAYRVGFRTPAHFSSAFKELYGVTPKDYKDPPKDLPKDSPKAPPQPSNKKQS